MLKKSPFYMVLRRELDRMVSPEVILRGVYRAASVLYILHVYDFRKRADGEHTDSGSGPRQHLHVPEIIRQVEAVLTFRVTRHYTDQETARHATQAKEIYGYLVIPNQFEADTTAGVTLLYRIITTMPC